MVQLSGAIEQACWHQVPLYKTTSLEQLVTVDWSCLQSECGSDTSSTDAQPPSSRPRGSELRKSPSSATTITLVHATRLPRVQQKYPSWELPRHQLTLLSILGHGNFGQVWYMATVFERKSRYNYYRITHVAISFLLFLP